MANTLTINVSVGYAGNNATVALAVQSLIAAVTGNGLNSLKSYSAPTADTAIPLGSVTVAGGVMLMVNNDMTNFVTVKSAVSGTKLAKLFPGYPVLIPFDPSITAPSTQSDTAPCSVSFCIFDK